MTPFERTHWTLLLNAEVVQHQINMHNKLSPAARRMQELAQNGTLVDRRKHEDVGLEETEEKMPEKNLAGEMSQSRLKQMLLKEDNSIKSVLAIDPSNSKAEKIIIRERIKLHATGHIQGV